MKEHVDKRLRKVFIFVSVIAVGICLYLWYMRSQKYGLCSMFLDVLPGEDVRNGTQYYFSAETSWILSLTVLLIITGLACINRILLNRAKWDEKYPKIVMRTLWIDVGISGLLVLLTLYKSLRFWNCAFYSVYGNTFIPTAYGTTFGNVIWPVLAGEAVTLALLCWAAWRLQRRGCLQDDQERAEQIERKNSLVMEKRTERWLQKIFILAFAIAIIVGLYLGILESEGFGPYYMFLHVLPGEEVGTEITHCFSSEIFWILPLALMLILGVAACLELIIFNKKKPDENYPEFVARVLWLDVGISGLLVLLTLYKSLRFWNCAFYSVYGNTFIPTAYGTTFGSVIWPVLAGETVTLALLCWAAWRLQRMGRKQSSEAQIVKTVYQV